MNINIIKSVILFVSDSAVKKTLDEIVNNNISEDENRTPLNKISMDIGTFIISSVVAALITQEFSGIVDSGFSKLSKKFLKG